MDLDRIPDANPPVKLPFGQSFVMPDFRNRMPQGVLCLYREVNVPIWAESEFHRLFKKHRTQFFERGFSIQSHDGRWKLMQWLQPHASEPNVYTQTPTGQERLDAVRVPEFTLPEVQVELVPLPSELEAKLLDYQVIPSRQLLRALVNGPREWGFAGAWDASGLGTGKTYQSLATALAYAATMGTDAQVFVVCPMSVIGSRPYHGGRGSGWHGAFAHFGAMPRGIWNYETLRTGNRDWVKLEYYTDGERDPKTGKPVTKKRFNWTLDPQKTVFIFDEAHRVKRVSLNQGLAMAAIRQKFPCIFVSGTLASDPTHMRATGRAVGLHSGGNWIEFLRKNGCSGTHKKGKDWKFCGGLRGREILRHLHHVIFPARGARVRIEDLGDRFPESQILVEAFKTDNTAKIQAAFLVAQKAMDTLKKQGDITEEQRLRLVGSAYMDAWHESERTKVEMIVEKVEDEIEQGRSVAVFMNFVDTRKAVMEKLKTECGIFGEQPMKDRIRCIDDFQNDRSRVIVCNIDAGGVGVSLHDLTGTFPRTSIILPTNKAESLIQAFGRVHRSGGMSKSRQFVLYAAGTVEEDICNAVRARMANITTLNDGCLHPPRVF